jgi:Uma2 family endonuclease
MGKPIVFLPRLENGDHLTPAEFEQRYHAMPHVKKAELIEGVVYMSSPVRAKHHGRPHSQIMTWLGTYEAATPGVESYDNTTVRLDDNNEPQPDALLRLPAEFGGNSRLTEDDYIEGPPELIVEIAASSAAYDLHEKRQVYLKNGVQEYLVWRIDDECLDWFILKNGEYVTLQPDEEGLVYSQVFPGLVLDVGALLLGDLATVLATLQKHLQSTPPRAFVEKLQG